MFFSEFPSEIKKKHLKMKKKVENGSKKVFQPAFGCTQHPKAGQNTQHTSFSFSSYGSIGWAILIWPYRNPQWTIKSFFRKIPDFLSTEFGSLLNLISVQTVILKNPFFQNNFLLLTLSAVDKGNPSCKYEIIPCYWMNFSIQFNFKVDLFGPHIFTVVKLK